MAVAFSSSGAAAAANNASITPGLPSGLAAGQLMVAICCIRSSTATINTPSGWTRADDRGGTNTHVYVFWRAWQSGDAAPTFTITGGASNVTVLGRIASFTGADTTTPNMAGVGLANGATSSTQIPYFGVTSVEAFQILAWSRSDDAGTFTWSSPPFDATANDSTFFVSSTLGTDAAQGGQTSTTVNPGDGNGTITGGASANSISFFTQIAAPGGATLTQGVDDTLSLADALAQDRGLLLGETLSLADVINRNFATVSDVLALTDAIAKDRGLSLSESLAVVDSALVELIKLVAVDDTVSLADSIALTQAKAITDTVALADAQTKDQSRSVADTLSLADAVALGRFLTVDEALAVADALAKDQGKAIADSVTPSDALTFERAMVLAESLGIADVIDPLHTPAGGVNHEAGIDDTVTLAEALAFQRGITMAEAVALADNVVTELGGAAAVVMRLRTMTGVGL